MTRDNTLKQWIPSWFGSPNASLPNAVAARGCSESAQGSLDFYILRQFEKATFRAAVQLTVGGERLRVLISNRYGGSVLSISRIEVTVGVQSGEVSFGGRSQLYVPAGQSALSDPLELQTPDGAMLEIAIHYPEPIPATITFASGAEACALTPWQAQRRAEPAMPGERLPAYFLTRIDIECEHACGAIVAIGDSLTAGGRTRWPALLARRLLASGARYGVLNAGIGGNRLLRDGLQGSHMGRSILTRFQPDALDQAGVRHVVLSAGVNDIGMAETAWDNSPCPTLHEITTAIQVLHRRAHERHIGLHVATLTPFAGVATAGYYTPRKEELRQELNAWIRSSCGIESCIDFDGALADPDRPTGLRPDFDCGDHLHPNDAGQRALSNAIDLSRLHDSRAHATSLHSR